MAVLPSIKVERSASAMLACTAEIRPIYKLLSGACHESLLSCDLLRHEITLL